MYLCFWLSFMTVLCYFQARYYMHDKKMCKNFVSLGIRISLNDKTYFFAVQISRSVFENLSKGSHLGHHQKLQQFSRKYEVETSASSTVAAAAPADF